MTPTPLAIGFDLDYTLWDPDAFFLTFLEGLAVDWPGRLDRGREELSRAFRSAHRRLTLAHPGLFDAALRDLDAWSPERVAELVDRYHRHRPPAQPYPGAIELLDSLARRGLPRFLVTDGHAPTQRHKVAALGLAGRFNRMVFTGDFQPDRGKPSPFPFRVACGSLGLDPARCMYVGDNPLCDFQGPRRLGMTTVGVSTGPFVDLPVPADRAPHRRIADLRELEELL